MQQVGQTFKRSPIAECDTRTAPEVASMRPWLGHSLRRNRAGSQYRKNVAWIARSESLINDFSNRAIAISQVQFSTHQHQETGFFTVSGAVTKYFVKNPVSQHR
jgi:hypothetical protein